MTVRDTNLASCSLLLPQQPPGFCLRWYEPWYWEFVRKTRREVASYVDAVARDLGLPDFESKIGWM